MAVGRSNGKATMFLTIDGDVPEDVVKKVGEKVGVEEIHYVKLE